MWCGYCILLLFVFFFFKQKTAYEMRISDWSSDVCSSDLLAGALLGHRDRLEPGVGPPRVLQPLGLGDARHNAVPLQGVKPARGFSAHAETGGAVGGVNPSGRRDRVSITGWLRVDRKSTRLNSSH